MAYGVEFGSSAWGDGAEASSGFSIADARAVASNIVRVEFTMQPLFGSPLRLGDASNVARWELVNLDTGEVLTILGVRAVSDDGNALELVVLGQFQNSLVQYQVSAADLYSTVDESPLVDPREATFYGLAQAAALVRGPLVDLANKQTEITGYDGHLVNGSSGDYLKESGVPLLEKLMIREVISEVDSFIHLAGQNYGLGVKDKRLYRDLDLSSLGSAVERVARRQPEVKAASARITNGRGTLTIAWSVKLQNGQEHSFARTRPIPGVAF